MKLGWLDYLIIFALMLAVTLAVYFLSKETAIPQADGSLQVKKNLFKYKTA